MKYIVTIVGGIAPNAVELKKGQRVRLMADPFNPVDPKAVMVLDEAGTQVGYLASSPETGLPGSRLAAGIQKLVTSAKVAEAWAKVGASRPMKNKGGHDQARWEAEVFFVPNRSSANEPSVQVVEATLSGAVASNPEKNRLMAEAQRQLDAAKDPDSGDGHSDTGPISIALCLRRVMLHGEEIVKCFFPEERDNANSAGSLKSVPPELDALLEKAAAEGRDLLCTAVEKLSRSTLRLEVSDAPRTMQGLYPSIDQAIARCVGQANEVENRVSQMISAGVEDSLIQDVLDEMFPLDDPRIPVPQTFYQEASGQSNLADMLAYMLMGKPIRVVGEKGTGKNTLIESACWLLGRPMCRIQGSERTTEMDILGSRGLKDGSTLFEPSEMIRTLSAGGVAVIDEANMIPPGVLGLMHSLTDGARSVELPELGKIVLPKSACITYTLNEGYVGTGEMNPATVDRCATLLIRQGNGLKALLARAVPTADPKDIDLCCTVSDLVAKAVKDGMGLSPDAVTVRGYIDALEMAPRIPLKRGLIQNVAHKLQSEHERAAVETIIAMVG